MSEWILVLLTYLILAGFVFLIGLLLDRYGGSTWGEAAREALLLVFFASLFCLGLLGASALIYQMWTTLA